jgi:hypothetical protein
VEAGTLNGKRYYLCYKRIGHIYGIVGGDLYGEEFRQRLTPVP